MLPREEIIPAVELGDGSSVGENYDDYQDQ